MDSKLGFLNIPKKDCLQAASEIAKNAENHLENANILAANKQFAIAASLSLMAVEEFIKSLILSLDGAGFRFRSLKQFKAIFTNHELRYFLSFFIFCCSIIDDDIEKVCIFLTKNQEKLGTALESLPPDIQRKTINLFGKTLGTIFMAGYLTSKLNFIKKEIVWFKEMDLSRQMGIYTGYSDKVQSPLDFTEDQFVQLSQRIEKVVKAVKILNENIKNESDFVLSMKKQIHNQPFYKSLDHEIEKARAKGSNIFDSFLISCKDTIGLISTHLMLQFLELFLNEILPEVLQEEGLDLKQV